MQRVHVQTPFLDLASWGEPSLTLKFSSGSWQGEYLRWMMYPPPPSIPLPTSHWLRLRLICRQDSDDFTVHMLYEAGMVNLGAFRLDVCGSLCTISIFYQRKPSELSPAPTNSSLCKSQRALCESLSYCADFVLNILRRVCRLQHLETVFHFTPIPTIFRAVLDYYTINLGRFSVALFPLLVMLLNRWAQILMGLTS